MTCLSAEPIFKMVLAAMLIFPEVKTKGKPVSDSLPYAP